MLSLKGLKAFECTSWDENLWLLESGYKGYHVVDGQQRLTTCIILLNSILVYANSIRKEGLKHESIEQIRNRYIITYNHNKYLKSYKFGYEKDNPSFVYLRNKNNLLDDDEFLKNHCVIFFKYTRNKGDDYIQFLLNIQFTPKAVYGERAEFAYKNILDDPESEIEAYESTDILLPREIIDYIDSLKDLAKYWYYSFNPGDCNELTNEEVKWINKLNRIGMNYFRTLIVASLYNKSITSIERVKVYKTIEKFIFVCFRLGKFNSNFDSVNSYKFARDLNKNEINVEEIIAFFEEDFNKHKVNAVNAFQTDRERLFKNYCGYYSWHSRWYFLFEYEAHLSEGRNIAKLDDWNKFKKSEKERISIEHSYPQKPTDEYWQNNFKEYPNELNQHCLANSLGNLLALSQSVNSSLQNNEFRLKKKASDERNGYDTGSYSEQEVAKYDDWTPNTILEKGLKLLSFMEKRWNFNFKDEKQKISCLGLDFLKKDMEKENDLY